MHSSTTGDRETNTHAREASRIAGLSISVRWRATLALFCAKEAAFKALDERGGPLLTFRSLEVTPAEDATFLVRVLAAPSIYAKVDLAQDDELTFAIAIRNL